MTDRLSATAPAHRSLGHCRAGARTALAPLARRGLWRLPMHRRLRLGLAVAAACAALAVSATWPGVAAPTADLPIPSERLIAVTDVYGMPLVNGCCDVTLADAATGKVLPRRRTLYADSPSAGQVDVTSDGTLVVWGSTDQVWFLRVLIWPHEGNAWTTGVFNEGWRQPLGGAIAISPDNGTLLVHAENSVRKYLVRNITTRSLGPVQTLAIDQDFRAPGDFRDQLVAAAIEFTADSETAYVVANDGNVYTLDVDSMAWRGEPIAYGVVAEPFSHRARRTFATLSPDERWLIINRGKNRTGLYGLAGELNLVDLGRSGRR